jgi:2-dehydropantoate 2-reductase
MKIAVIGPGAVGGYFGGVLARHGDEVAMIARPGPHMDAMRTNGLHLTTAWGDFTVHPQVTDDPNEVGPVDLVLYCVKLFHNPEALPLIAPLLQPDTTVLTLQNGVDSADAIAERYGWEHAMAGATYIQTGRPGPGQIRQAGLKARIAFGEQDGSHSDRVKRLSSILDREGIQYDVVSDIVTMLWTKLVIVATVASLMTASRSSMPEVLDSPWGRYTLRALMEEVEAVARAKGIEIPPDVVDQRFDEAVAEAEHTQVSLQDDFTAERPLEIESILGMVVREGMALGVPVPASAALVASLWNFRHGAHP